MASEDASQPARGLGVLPFRVRVRLFAAAAAFLAGGMLARRALAPPSPSDEPLSFRLDPVPPQVSGVQFRHELQRVGDAYGNVRRFLQAVSAGGCAGDFDNDGWTDLLLTTAREGRPSKLWHNLGGFRFEESRLPELGRPGEGGMPGDCAFVDLDNDGWRDLWISGFSRGARVFCNVPGQGPGGRGWEDVTEWSGAPHYMTGVGVAFLDVEHDGDLDVVVAGFGPERYDPQDVSCRDAPAARGCRGDPDAVREMDRNPVSPRIHNLEVPDVPGASRVMPDSFGDARNGSDKRFFLNDGRGRFVEQDASAWGFDGDRWTHDVGTADFDRDGWTDVYFANDFGPDQLYRNLEGRRFDEQEAVLPTDIGRDASKGMNAEFADIDSDGWLDLYVTNVYATPSCPRGTSSGTTSRYAGAPRGRRAPAGVSATSRRRWARRTGAGAGAPRWWTSTSTATGTSSPPGATSARTRRKTTTST